MSGDSGSDESRFKFNDNQQIEGLYNAFDPNLISSIRNGELSDLERKNLLEQAFDLPLRNENDSYSITQSDFKKRINDLRYKLEQFSTKRQKSAQAVQDIQENFADRPGVDQTRQSILTPSAGNSILAGG